MTPADAHAALIRDFYDAFQRRDHLVMAACYAPEAQFSDPVFPDLVGGRIGAMWRMLCERATDLRVVASGITADADRGAAHWEAWYTFTATGRPVHNVIEAAFEFRNARVIRHTDTFDFPTWARQALGWKGLLLGWAPPLRRAVRRQAARSLDAFIAKHRLGG